MSAFKAERVRLNDSGVNDGFLDLIADNGLLTFDRTINDDKDQGSGTIPVLPDQWLLIAENRDSNTTEAAYLRLTGPNDGLLDAGPTQMDFLLGEQPTPTAAVQLRSYISLGIGEQHSAEFYSATQSTTDRTGIKASSFVGLSDIAGTIVGTLAGNEFLNASDVGNDSVAIDLTARRPSTVAQSGAILINSGTAVAEPSIGLFVNGLIQLAVGPSKLGFFAEKAQAPVVQPNLEANKAALDAEVANLNAAYPGVGTALAALFDALGNDTSGLGLIKTITI